MGRMAGMIAAAALALSLGACASGAGAPTSYASYPLREPGPVPTGWAGRSADVATYVQDSKHGEGNGV